MQENSYMVKDKNGICFYGQKEFEDYKEKTKNEIINNKDFHQFIVFFVNKARHHLSKNEDDVFLKIDNFDRNFYIKTIRESCIIDLFIGKKNVDFEKIAFREKIKTIHEKTFNISISEKTILNISQLFFVFFNYLIIGVSDIKHISLSKIVSSSDVTSFFSDLLKQQQTISFLDMNLIPSIFNNSQDIFDIISKTFHIVFKSKNIDHIANIYSLFSKKSIICYMHMLKNIDKYKHIFKSNMNLINANNMIDHFSDLAEKNHKLLLRTLIFSPFYEKKHIQNSKKYIKNKYSLTDAGLNRFIISYYKTFGFFKNISVSSCNNLNFNIGKSVNDQNKKMNHQYVKNKSSDHYIEELSSFIDPKKELRFDSFDSNFNFFNDYTDFSNTEFEPFFKNFIIGNIDDTITKEKNTVDLINQNNFFDQSIKFDFLKNLPYQFITSKIIPNIHSKSENKNFIFNNIYMPYDTILFCNRYYISAISFELLRRYMETDTSVENLNTIIKIFIEQFNDYSEELESECENLNNEYFSLNDNPGMNEKDQRIFLKKLISSYLNIIENLVINSDYYSCIFGNIIQLLTGKLISFYYETLTIKSFCIELYLVHLFEQHYGRKFIHKNKKDLKYISKIAEKSHYSFTDLLEKSFKYTEKKYFEYANTLENNLFENTIDVSENMFYDFESKSFNIGDFNFKPLIKHVDFISEGFIMRNCLKKGTYNNSKENIVFSVTNKNNNKFRVNFVIYIFEGDINIQSVYTYCNGKNKILNNEFNSALDLFKKHLNLLPNNTSKETIVYESSHDDGAAIITTLNNMLEDIRAA